MEGVPVEALVDPGAPVSIINNFLLTVLAKNKNPQQSPTEWLTEVEKRLQQPSFTNLQIMVQIDLTDPSVSISSWRKTIEAVLQVLSNAPVNLLLGTDLQSLLGFVLMSVKEDGARFDLVQENQWKVVNCPVSETAKPEVEQPICAQNGATVHLIQASPSF